nr:tyrosine-type recombinase/integrase [Rhodopirellula sp. JC639]
MARPCPRTYDSTSFPESRVVASIQQDPQSKNFRIRFRYGGRRYFRSLKTTELKVAQSILGRVEDTLRLLEQGRLEIPPKAEPGKFILSDGKINGDKQHKKDIALKELLETYQKRLPNGAKEPTTIKMETTHINNLLRLLPKRRSANSITSADLQHYVEKRLKEKRGERFISPETVKREMDTFRSIWNWATREYVEGPPPTSGLTFGKRDEKLPFMTWDEIETRIARGGLSEQEQADHWASLYLTMEQILEFLKHAKEHARYPFVHPMLTLVAYTGVRRSEMMRSRIDDFDFESRMVLVREKKRSKDKATTFRRVDMAEPVVKVLQPWFANHPGGQYAFCMPSLDNESIEALTCDQARDQFRRTFAKSKWQKVKGFHVLRHSFASNLASKGVDQRIIDLWMGHQTEEMRLRYRHLLPTTRKSAIGLLTV